MTDQTVLEPRAPMLVYLDHSILNQMLKGREKLREVFAANNMQVVYSDVSLEEISRSVGKEQEFLSLLEALSAQYLRLVLDDQWRYTDRAVIESVAPTAAYDAYLINQRESPTGDFGLSDLLQKLYGGHANMTFGEIAQSGQQDFGRLLDTLAHELVSSQVSAEVDVNAFLQSLPEMKRVFAATSSETGRMLDADTSRNQVRAIDGELGVGPKDLNNLVGSGILKQIWIRIAPKIPEEAITFDELFGLVRPRWVTDDRPITKLEQINSAYHQLNFLGYCRDKDMAKGIGGHFRDLTHAGMASFCSVFLSGDERQVKKARAVYEHLGIGTYAHHIPPA